MLLDTCALLWLANEQEKISEKVLQQINNSLCVYVSAITAFEIATKYNSGKLILPVRPEEWFNFVMEHHALTVIDINSEISFKSTELPPIHKDPCDRFIIATALLNNLKVVTADSNFVKYGLKVLL